jgi:hypothetical protein
VVLNSNGAAIVITVLKRGTSQDRGLISTHPLRPPLRFMRISRIDGRKGWGTHGVGISSEVGSPGCSPCLRASVAGFAFSMSAIGAHRVSQTFLCVPSCPLWSCFSDSGIRHGRWRIWLLPIRSHQRCPGLRSPDHRITRSPDLLCVPSCPLYC